MTAPASVEVVDQPEGIVHVIAKQRLEPKQRLGPFEAKRTTQKIDIESGFILKVWLLLMDLTKVTLCLLIDTF